MPGLRAPSKAVRSDFVKRYTETRKEARMSCTNFTEYFLNTENNCVHGPEFLISHKFINKLRAFYGERSLTAVSTRDHFWTVNLNQINPFQALITCFFKAHFNIILQSFHSYVVASGIFLFTFSEYNFFMNLYLSHACYVHELSNFY